MVSNEQFTGCTISGQPCRCFDTLTEAQRKLVDDHSVMINYKKGEIICRQGSFSSHIMYMKNGLAKVYLDDGKNSLVLKVISRGQLLGLSAINDEHSTFQYSAMAYVGSEVQLIDIGIFKQIIKENSDFSTEVINILGANSVLVNGRFFCLTHKQSFGRLADIILCLSNRIFKSEQFELQLSRRDLAELTGMSQETVIRLLKSFKEEGLIEITGKTFRILDFEKLKHISETG